MPSPEGDSLHRIALRLQPLVGARVAAPSPHPRGVETGVAEAVWHARLSPWLPVDRAGEGRLESLLAWARREMLATIRDRRPVRAIHRRAGRPCPRRGTSIRSGGIGADDRTAHWRPTCQPDPPASR